MLRLKRFVQSKSSDPSYFTSKPTTDDNDNDNDIDALLWGVACKKGVVLNL